MTHLSYTSPSFPSQGNLFLFPILETATKLPSQSGFGEDFTLPVSTSSLLLCCTGHQKPAPAPDTPLTTNGWCPHDTKPAGIFQFSSGLTSQHYVTTSLLGHVTLLWPSSFLWLLLLRPTSLLRDSMAGRIMAPTDIHILMGNDIADERKVTNMLTIKQRDSREILVPV